jgi:hypothetical protein
MNEPTLASNISQISTQHPTSYNKPQIGKVIAVILGDGDVLGVDNKDTAKHIYKANGAQAGIGNIYYLPANSSTQVSSLSFSDFTQIAKPAKPYSSNLRHYPQPGELVQIENIGSNNGFSEALVYYKGPINTWNDTQHNSTTGVSDIRNYVRPLRLKKGDISLEGRFGNSIRFSDLGTIINNGQYDTKNLDHVSESVSPGSSTIWMTYNHEFNFPVTGSNYLTKNHTKPDAIGKYKGHQIIMDSDRVNILSHTDDIIMYSRRSTEIYGEKILTLNSGVYTHLNSENIFIGKNSDNQAPSQAAVRGNDLVYVLCKLCEKLGDFTDSLSKSFNGPEGTEIVNITVAASLLQQDIKEILDKDIVSILSEQVFIE